MYVCVHIYDINHMYALTVDKEYMYVYLHILLLALLLLLLFFCFFFGYSACIFTETQLPSASLTEQKYQ